MIVAALGGLKQRLRRVTSSGEYMSEIDGLRFFAVVPVVMFHLASRSWRAFEALPGDVTDADRFVREANYLVWGAKTGVELFFVISGFIIAHPFVRASLGRGQRPTLGAFYGRRLTRLEPPYILAVLGSAAFLMLRGARPWDPVDGGHSFAASVAASLVYLHGLLFRELPHALPVGWSLEVEFTFYLAAPLLFGAFFSIPARFRAAVGVAALAAIIASINPLQAAIGDLIRFIVFRYLHFFVVGVVLCDLFQRHPAQRRSVWADAAFVAGWLGVLASESQMTDYRQPTSVALEVGRVAGYAAMFVGAFYGRFSPKVLGWGWLPTIGGMCYTIYLVHLPIQQVVVPLAVRAAAPDSFVVAWLIALLASMPVVAAVCVAFFLLVEKPFMQRDWPQRLRRWITGAAG